jgi:urease accessory protein
LRNDAIFLSAACQDWHSLQAVDEINQLALAAAGSAELHMETVAQGQAFVDAIDGWSESMHFNFPDQPCLSVAVGAACGSADICAHSAIVAFAHAFLANQLQMAIRLSVMGQTGAAQILADLEPHIIEFAGSAETATIEDLGNATIMADILSMRHETQNGRMFRS